MQEFIRGLTDYSTPVGGYIPNYIFWITALILSGVEFAPVKVYPLKWIARTVGKYFTQDATEAIKEISERLNNHLEEDKLRRICDEEEKIENLRRSILTFADDLRRNLPHSNEKYRQVMRDVDKYETYCHLHPEFRNNEAKASIQLIKTRYNEHLLNNDFL